MSLRMSLDNVDELAAEVIHESHVRKSFRCVLPQAKMTPGMKKDGDTLTHN